MQNSALAIYLIDLELVFRFFAIIIFAASFFQKQLKQA